MLLAAVIEGDKPIWIKPESEVPVGTKVY